VASGGGGGGENRFQIASLIRQEPVPLLQHVSGSLVVFIDKVLGIVIHITYTRNAME